MIKRIIFIVFAVALLACVVGLGFLASRDSRYIIWFGLAAAILAPLAFVIFGQAFKASDRELLAQLSKVPQIREMMNRAESEEERIRILELERQKLDETIRVEARRQTLSEAQSRLEEELEDKIEEYDATVLELRLLDEEIDSSPVREEIGRVRTRLAERKRGRVIVIRVGKRELTFPVRKLGSDPFGMLFLMLLHVIEKLQKKRNAQPQPGADADKPRGSG